jgi:pyrroloquinoline quinone (PQQ) biosynthesis protein C
MMTGESVRQNFLAQMEAIAEAHLPSRSPFFGRLGGLQDGIARSPELLGEIHLAYQSAMHSTRVAVYHLPYLDAPALRARKVQIFVDDDGLANGDTHHYQLTRAFTHIGAHLRLSDEEFGTIEELCARVDPPIARFMQLAGELYPRSHGAWCIVEMLSVDWMTALADALARHFPAIRREPYFAECFDNEVEERHAAESLAIAADTIVARPHLLEPTLADARTMAEALDGMWRHLDDIVTKYAAAAAVADDRAEHRLSA